MKASSASHSQGEMSQGEMSQQEALEVRQAQAARLILQEAQNIGQAASTEQQLNEWRDKAQRVVRGEGGRVKYMEVMENRGKYHRSQSCF